MALTCYTNGKNAEKIVKDELRKIGCYVDDKEKLSKDFGVIYNSGNIPLALHLHRNPFKFYSQQAIKADRLKIGVDKIPDFVSSNFFVEVKSISNESSNLKQSRKRLMGEILVEYKQYSKFFKETKHKRTCPKSVYYVLSGPCDKNEIFEHISSYNDWYWMKDSFHLVYLDEFIDIVKNGLYEYELKLTA